MSNIQARAGLRAVFNELKKLGHWKGVNPLSTLRQIKIAEKELSFLTLDQIGALLAEQEKSENPDALLITKLCLATAARWSEIETMTTSQLRNGQVHFARTKTGKNRDVPICPYLFFLIRPFVMRYRQLIKLSPT